MANVSIQLSDSDLSLLQRVAKAEDRRFQDLMQLIFANGLDCYFFDEYVSVERIDSEISAEELKQIALNDTLSKEKGFWQLSEEERIAKGYKKGFCRTISNHDISKSSDPQDLLIAPIAERIRSLALD